MTINPNKDLLIFRMRIEREQAGIRSGPQTRNNPFHVINFEAIEERIERPIVAGMKSGIKKILEEQEKARIVVETVRTKKSGAAQEPKKEQSQHGQPAAESIVNPGDQINEIDESVDKVLDMLNKISEKQKVISDLDGA
jgi:hypothetical protein